jgi:hypothetical protein
MTPRRQHLWISCPKATGRVVAEDTGNCKIVAAPPIWGKFIGQPLHRLIGWLWKFGEVEVKRL